MQRWTPAAVRATIVSAAVLLVFSAPIAGSAVISTTRQISGAAASSGISAKIPGWRIASAAEARVPVAVEAERPIACGSDSPAASAEDRRLLRFSAERLIDRPIIAPGMPGLAREGGRDNINGPSLIRVPDWVPNAKGKYYLYFAHHGGKHIRLAYADELTGPWTIVPGGVLGVEQSPGRGHIASPDVHVDHAERRIRMYFHQPGPPGSPISGQVSFAAVSRDGLKFEPRPEVLGKFYFRVFEYDGWFYALAKNDNEDGIIYRSRDPLSEFRPGPRYLPKVRHTAAWVDRPSAMLYVFYSLVGEADRPEHICVSSVDLRDDWMQWRFSPPQSVLLPERDWEGARLPHKPSSYGAAAGPVRQLRDPAVFRDGDQMYLLYSTAGEQGIGIARLNAHRAAEAAAPGGDQSAEPSAAPPVPSAGQPSMLSRGTASSVR